MMLFFINNLIKNVINIIHTIKNVNTTIQLPYLYSILNVISYYIIL